MLFWSFTGHLSKTAPVPFAPFGNKQQQLLPLKYPECTVISQALLDKNILVSSADKGLRVDEWLNPTWIPIRFNLHQCPHISLSIFPLSFPRSSSSWHMAKHQTSLLMLKWNISQRDQCLCVRVKKTIKQNIPNLFPFVAFSSPLSLLKPRWAICFTSDEGWEEHFLTTRRPGPVVWAGIEWHAAVRLKWTGAK